MATEITKPLLKAGVSYTFEIARCLVLGIVLSVGGFVLLLWMAPSGSGKGLLGLAGVSSLALPAVYALLGHQRGLGKVLSMLTASHGALFFDQTLGRFMDAAEARKPGATAALLATPGKFTEAFKAFVGQASFMPGWLKRVALHYAGKLSERIEDGLLPAGVGGDGRIDRPQFRQWAVDQMQDQFSPSWQPIAVLAGLHLLLVAALGWMGR